MQHIKNFIFTFLLLNISYFSKAQNTNIQQLTIENGLSQGMIFDILKDSDGFMWFATKNGLNRYDGYQFKTFFHNPYDSLTLSDDVVTALFEDSQKRLWVGTQNNGLSYYDRQKAIFYPTASFTKDGYLLRKSAVNQIIEDKFGNIWFSAFAKVYCLTINDDFPSDTQSITVKTYPIQYPKKEKPPNVRKLFITQNNTIYAATDNRGLFTFNPQKDSFKTVPLPFVQPSRQQILNLFEYPKNTLWIGSVGGLFRLSNDQIDVFDLEKLDIFKSLNRSLRIGHFVLNQANQEIYFSLEANTPLYHFNPHLPPNDIVFHKYQQDPILPTERITDLLLDSLNNLWIGTGGYGIRKLSLKESKFQHFGAKNSLKNIFQDKSKNIFVSDIFNIRLIDTLTGNAPVAATKTQMPLKVNSLFTTKDGTTWGLFAVAGETYNGLLYQFNDNYEVEKVFEHTVNTGYYAQMQEDVFGNILIAGEQSNFVVFNRQTETFENYDFSHLITTQARRILTFTFYLDGQGILWIGKPYGLVRVQFDKKGKPVDYQLFQNDRKNINSLNHNSVAVCVDDPIEPATYLWIGTKGGGLNKLNKKTLTFEHFTTIDGLPNNVIYGILFDEKNNLWASTNRGISKFNPTQKTFRNYTAADGLQHDEFNTNAYFKNKQTGELFFGGINGLTAFFPHEITPSTYQPDVVITNFKIHNETVLVKKTLKEKGENPLTKSIEFTKKIKLAWHQNQITLEFAALDFTVSEKNQYQYQLVGVDKNWIHSGNSRIANYANLGWGNYTFKVKGTNSSGIWNETPTILKIKIRPPWWHTWWAYFVYFMIVFFAILQINRIQINRIKLRNDLAFEQKEAERRKELDKTKTQFFSNITHEFRTPLTLIIEPIRRLIKESKNKLFLNQLRLVEKNGLKLLNLVNQLLDLSKLENQKMQLVLHQGNILDCLNPIIESFSLLGKQKNINIVVTAPLYINDFDFDKDKIEKIAYNLLSNALKFTSTGGIIEIALHEKENYLHLSVRDTGIGIPKADQALIFDRFYQVDGSHTRKGEGTGIGLALVKELVVLMKGTITVESKLGEGTVFKITLPIERQLSATSLSASAAKTIAVTGLNLANLSVLPSTTLLPPTPLSPDAENVVLLIEDNDELRAFIKQSIGANYHILEVDNGQTGIEMALEYLPNIVISDLMMPKRDGFEVCQLLKTNEKTAHIPIVLLTAKTAMESKLKGLEYGADAYMSKPFSTEELLLRIKNLIEIRQTLRKKYSQNKGKSEKIFSNFDHIFLNRLNGLLKKELTNGDFNVTQLSERLKMSRSQLYRKIKALTNQSVSEYLRNFRLQEAYNILKEGNVSIADAIDATGFKNQSYFAKIFKEKFGLKPSEMYVIK